MARAKEIEADLRLVAKTARTIEKKNQSFRNTFTLSRGSMSYQEIIEKADSFIADAPANKTYFDKYALTTEFFTELETDTAEFREAAHGQADASRTNVGAHADTEAILKDTLDTRGELDRALRNHYRNNPAKLAEWLTASHIERKKKRDDEPPTDENPPTS